MAGIKFKSDEEIAKLRAASFSKKKSLVFELCLQCGLRIGEILPAHYDYYTHPDTGKRVPTKIGEAEGYRHVVTRKPGLFRHNLTASGLTIFGAKNGKSRVVPIPPSIISQATKIWPNWDRMEDQLLFNFSIDTFQRYLVELSIRAGVSRTSPHMLRHSFAVRYLRNGGNIEHLRNLLGHSSLATTQVYLVFADEERVKDFNKVLEHIQEKEGRLVDESTNEE